MVAGSRYLQMTGCDLGSLRNAGHEHLVAQLSRPLEVQRVIKQGGWGATEQKVHLSPATLRHSSWSAKMGESLLNKVR